MYNSIGVYMCIYAWENHLRSMVNKCMCSEAVGQLLQDLLNMCCMGLRGGGQVQ